MRISDLSSDVCSSDLLGDVAAAGWGGAVVVVGTGVGALGPRRVEIWRSAGSGSAGASVVVVVAGAAAVVGSAGTRSEERRAGKGCVSPRRYRGAPLI